MKIITTQTLAFASICQLCNMSYASPTGFKDAQVNAAIYCCTSTNESDRVSEIVSAIVDDTDDTAEYQIDRSNGERIIGVSIDISDSQIAVDFNEFSRTTQGEFNGYVFDFSPLDSFPEIASISLNSLTTFEADQISLDFDSDTISISLPGLRITPDSSILVDVVFVQPEDDCVVNYTIKEPLDIPCLTASSETGAILLAANLSLSPWPGCNYRIDTVSNLDDQFSTIDRFRIEFESKKQECEISIVHYSTISPNLGGNQETWTISGFDDNEEFDSVELGALDTNLIAELRLQIQDKSSVTAAITSMLGRTPINDPLAYTLIETRAIESASINTDNCQASFDLNSLLVIPCIDIPDSQGNLVRYQAVFEKINDEFVPGGTAFPPGVVFSSQTAFTLLSSGKVVE